MSDVKESVKPSQVEACVQEMLSFSHTKVVSDSKFARERLCFTKETAVGGCEGRRCETAIAAMVAHARLSSDRSSIGKRKRRRLNALVLGCGWWRSVIGECD